VCGLVVDKELCWEGRVGFEPASVFCDADGSVLMVDACGSVVAYLLYVGIIQKHPVGAHG
jgi:hypothetical protein